MSFKFPSLHHLSFYANRRAELVKNIVKNNPQVSHGAILLFAAFENEKQAFRQESSFYYYTGISEPGVALWIDLDGKTTLFVPHCSTVRAKWVASTVAPTQEHTKLLGVDEIRVLGKELHGFVMPPFFDQETYQALIDEIQKLIISHAILATPKKSASVDASGATDVPINKSTAKKATEIRKNIIIDGASASEKIKTLLQYLKNEPAISIEKSKSAAGENLGDADRVCSIGRGLAAQEDLPMIQALAEALGAAVGCSRPIAEENEWMPLDRYIGISGQKFTGSLYLAIGISGQIQHLGGIREAKIIVAINSDAKAPIFAHADYGIVGDLYEFVPLLTQTLQNEHS